MHLPTLDDLQTRDLRRARKRLRRVVRRASEAAARVVGNGKVVAETSTQQIRDRPLAAALVLFGAGLAAGALVTAAAKR